ncbi:MAG: response regulator [Roseateles depolymerans]|uniref:Response regulator n=1 Tax=Roseateles depolymerans TaxID=76731 RepID=A0A2W5DVR2_9BURK|nr:MAG: response regulator [Roseateles depolymerans]
MSQRLLLIEDDLSIARFVEMALEDLPALELRNVRSLAEAQTALAAGGWHLVISDLMLPDGSAELLLREGLAQRDGAPPWVVFSAGLNAQRQTLLSGLGVKRVLHKPVALGELLDTVEALLLPADAETAAPEASAASAPAAPMAADPVAQHFGGDRVLFEGFLAGCVERFADDLAQGDAACARGDAPELRRVAHGLKAVLHLLGQPALSELARGIEDDAAAGGLDAAAWRQLAEGLIGLGARRG